MKVVIPVGDLHMGGGCKVLVDITNALQAAGHEAEIVIPENASVKYDVRGELTVVPALTREHIPPGDLILTNFYTTCRGALEAHPDKCVRLSLGFEPYWVPEPEQALWTYKQGMPVITISHWLDDQIAVHTNQRSQVVPLGVDPAVFHPAAKREGTSSPKVIMYIARNPAAGYALKGFSDFQRAIEQLRASYEGDFVVHMVCTEGDLSLPGVPYRIFQPATDDEMAELYRGADLFVSTSWFEAFALPPLEAMACGTPVVTTNSGGLLEYCEHLKNAILTQPKNPDELAAGMLRVLRDQELAASLASEGLATAARFTKEKFLNHMISVLEDIARDRERYIEPKVSIVIPVYNCPYVDQAIDSALAQTYSNLEIIVVNDGSTMYMDKIDPYRSRIRYLEKANGGTASALNAGIRQANGRYVSWLSADDVFKPDKTVRQTRMMRERQAAISYAAFFYMNEAGEVLSGPIRTSFQNDVQFYETMSQWCPINGCTVVLQRDVFDRVGLFDESLPYTHDYEFWLRALQYYRFEYFDEPLLLYRVHDDMGTKRHERVIQKEIFIVQQKYRKAMEQVIARGGAR